MLREFTNTDLLTIIFVVCLLCIALSKFFFAKRFETFTALIINDRYTKIYVKDQHFFDLFESLLFVNFCLNLGVFIYLFLKSLAATNAQILIFKYSILIGAFFMFKVLFERLLSSLFNIEGLINTYLFSKISFRNYLGLFLLPVNTFLVYSIETSTKTLIIIAVGIICIFIIGLLTFLKSNLNLFKRSLFYFILYLCALEIAPYLIVYQFIAIK